MKKISITAFSKYKTCYQVGLGNGTVHKFTNLKTTQKFLVDTSKFLTAVLCACNDIFIELHTQCRELWLLSNKLNEDAQIRKELETLEHLLTLTVRRCEWENGPYYSFIDLEKFCFFSKRLIKTLQSVSTVQHTDTLRRYRLESIFSKIYSEERKLHDYGQIEAAQIIDVSSYKIQSENETMQATA
jgi:hypothetical protein